MLAIGERASTNPRWGLAAIAVRGIRVGVVVA
jgi:hypothetical protein